MQLRDLRQTPADATAFTVTLSLSVEDARALWTAAAEKALQAPGATLADVLDTIGPREDPSLGDCIAMLTAPAAVAGCALDDFSVRAETCGSTALAERIVVAADTHFTLLPAANG
jgi:hypothetical protein